MVELCHFVPFFELFLKMGRLRPHKPNLRFTPPGHKADPVGQPTRLAKELRGSLSSLLAVRQAIYTSNPAGALLSCPTQRIREKNKTI
jgi:hypothetical protein